MKKITLLMICLTTMFVANAQLNSVAIVGDGAGGWPANTPGEVDAKQMSTTDGVHWTYDNLGVTTGSIKFRGNNAWALPYNWGGGPWPSGTTTVDGPGITSVQGVYDVTFNSNTGEYSFIVQTGVYPVMALIGEATPGGWDADTDMTTLDGITYSIVGVPLTPGQLKFRQDHSWTATTNWGGDNWPTGTGIVDEQGGAIDVAIAGSYNVTFNRNTLAYNFYFPTIAYVGDATPTGWPTGAQGEVDAQQMTTTDGVNYSISSIVLSSANSKFRAENAWARQWGGTTNPGFPTGVGAQSGNDIFVNPASTYSVALNIATGDYSFTDILGVNTLAAPSFKVYPNPTENIWNFSASTGNIKTIQIADVTGKIVMTVTSDNQNTNVDGSQLSTGVYFAKVSTETAVNTIKLIKN
ncbi:MAG: T9SS type A sorting domain-containing protein [Flavobacterium sp.]|nr:T9SS type A sorting domain-containing protein [Flavobacterium sp.]